MQSFKIIISYLAGIFIGYYLGDILGSFIQGYLWDFIGTLVKYIILTLSVIIGLLIGAGVVSDDNDMKNIAYGLLGVVVGTIVGFYVGYTVGDFFQTLIEPYLWDFVGSIILFFMTILGTFIGVIVGTSLAYNVSDGLDNQDVEEDDNTPYQSDSESSHKSKQKHRNISDELTITVAFYLSSIDDETSPQEGKVITSLGKKLLKKSSSEEEQEAKDRINGYIKSAHKSAKNNTINIDRVLKKINKEFTLNEKNFLFEECLYIAAADGVTHENEIDFLKYLIETTYLNRSKSKYLMEKILPININGKERANRELEESLGITSNMSKHTISSILKREYKNWNQRVGLSDLIKREEAEQMLYKIAELRKKYRD